MSSLNTSIQLHQDIIPFVTEDVMPLIDRLQGKVRFSAHLFTGNDLKIMLQDLLDTKVNYVTCVTRDVLVNTTYVSSNGFRCTFGEMLDLQFGFDLRMKLGRRRFAMLRKHFGLEQVLPLTEAIVPDPMRIPRKNTVLALMYYFGSSMAFDHRSADRLTALLRMMPNYIPLGECAQVPGNIVVLTP